MLKSQTATLLAKMQLIDNRTVDAATVEAWHEIIGHLEYADAMAGLTLHRRDSTDYVTPAHIVQAARRARTNREAEANKTRALTASPVHTRSTPPGWFREAIANFGRTSE